MLAVFVAETKTPSVTVFNFNFYYFVKIIKSFACAGNMQELSPQPSPMEERVRRSGKYDDKRDAA